jgi:ribosome modulation factor
MEVNGQPHAPAALFPRKEPRSYWIGGWVGSREGMDIMERRKIRISRITVVIFNAI